MAEGTARSAAARRTIFRFRLCGTARPRSPGISQGIDGGPVSAFTGKQAGDAAQGLPRRTTIHSLIYSRSKTTRAAEFRLWMTPGSKAKLIIIDECSMVDADWRAT